MKPYQHILVGVNYTDASRHALLKAGQIAKATGGNLTAYHVIPAPGFDEYRSFYSIEHESAIRAARSSLEGFVEEVLGIDHHAKCQIREGIPHHELASHANNKDYDLLVLGDDDYAINPKKSGQFAIKILRFATMPVLLVNRPEQDDDDTVTACVDFSNSTDPVLRHAALFADFNKSSLEIAHACAPPWLRPERLRYQTEVFEDEGLKQQFREILEVQISSIADSAAKYTSARITTTPIEHDSPVDALIDHLSTSGRGLIVVGRVGKGFKGIISDFLGGTAETIIRHSNHSILIIPILD